MLGNVWTWGLQGCRSGGQLVLAPLNPGGSPLTGDTGTPQVLRSWAEAAAALSSDAV